MGEELYPSAGPRQQDVTLKGRRSHWILPAFLAVFAVLWSAIAFPIAYFTIRDEGLQFDLPHLPMLMFPLAGIVLLGVAGWSFVRAILLSMRFGQAAAVVSVQPGYPGETIRIAAAQLLKTDTPISQATLELRCDEWVRWRRGTNTYTETRTVFRDTRTFDDSCVTNGHVQLVAEFTIPPDAMHSFHASDNHVEWIIMFHIDVPGWPDPKREFAYLVAPRRASSVERQVPRQPEPVLHHQNKARVAIELEPGRFGDSYRYYLGDPIAGTVTVSTDHGLNCRGVYVQLNWRTSGKGDCDEKTVSQEYVHRGPLPAGENKFSFRFNLPDGPASYDGEILSVNWYISAWVDLAWARDPGCERIIWVEMPPADHS